MIRPALFRRLVFFKLNWFFKKNFLSIKRLKKQNQTNNRIPISFFTINAYLIRWTIVIKKHFSCNPFLQASYQAIRKATGSLSADSDQK